MWHHKALAMHNDGLSGREIGRRLGIPKSTVNAFLEPYRANDGKPRILIFDIETTPILAYTWSLYPKAIPHNHLVRDFSILTWSAKWLGHDDMLNDHTLQYGDPLDDFEVVQNLCRLLDMADIVVAHNGDGFDLKKLNARRKIHGLPKYSPVRSVDTLKVARREYGFTSNRLDYIGEILVGDRKVKHSGLSLWLRCMDGDADAFREMIEYNDQDVRLLEAVYLDVRGDDRGHPNVSLYTKSDDIVCTACGSDNMDPTDQFSYTASQKYRLWKCDDCGHYSRERNTSLPKEQKERSLLSAR